VRLWRAPPPAYPTPTRRQATPRNADARRGAQAAPGTSERPLWLHAAEHAAEPADGAPDTSSDHEPAVADGAEAEQPDLEAEASALRHTSAMANRLVRACSEISVGDTVTEHLARLLSNFCGSRAIQAGGECWEVTLDLDPRVLPDTRLTLRLSPHTLWLRFHAGHPRARDLLSEHGDALRQRIHVLLERRVDVELDLW